MSQENVEVVKRAIAAVNARDIDGYLDCCSEDVVLRTPLAEITGVYEGADGIKRFLVDIDDAGPDFRIDAERVEPVGASQVLAFTQITASGRSSGIPQGAAPANVYDLVDGKINRIRIFLDRRDALKAVGLAEYAFGAVVTLWWSPRRDRWRLHPPLATPADGNIPLWPAGWSKFSPADSGL